MKGASALFRSCVDRLCAPFSFVVIVFAVLCCAGSALKFSSGKKEVQRVFLNAMLEQCERTNVWVHSVKACWEVAAEVKQITPYLNAASFRADVLDELTKQSRLLVRKDDEQAGRSLA